MVVIVTANALWSLIKRFTVQVIAGFDLARAFFGVMARKTSVVIVGKHRERSRKISCSCGATLLNSSGECARRHQRDENHGNTLDHGAVVNQKRAGRNLSLRRPGCMKDCRVGDAVLRLHIYIYIHIFHFYPAPTGEVWQTCNQINTIIRRQIRPPKHLRS
ncbi:hypothetical protein BSKO_14097 [Bryopsis sp. KO-2023]|nr:hypothetical protein BSKO_14097 [Bryopsis sp. KO-2023]